MPRIFGLNLVALLLATFAFFFAGFVIYGVLFSDLWMSIEGVSEEDAAAAGMGWLAPALLITVLQVIGLGLILQWRKAASLGAAVTTAIVAWALIALPLMAYDPIYIPGQSPMSLVIDGAHLFVGWVSSAVILTLLK
ncbi:MAG: DUF1761 domain-containing protein [Pseudomonadota bacterium]